MNRVKYEILTRRLGANKRVKGELEQLKQATGVDMARGLKQCMGSLMEEMQARLEGEVHALIAKVAAEETPGHAAHGTDDQDEARQTTSHAADDDESDEAENMESKSKRARQS